MKPVVNICTPGAFDFADSYGLIASRIALHLAGVGCHVNAYAMLGADAGNQSPQVRAITQMPRIPAFGGVFLGYPSNYHLHGAPFAAGPRVALTMFESSCIPSKWVPILNGMDAVVTPSRFCADVFQACGVTVPVHVVPLGIGESYRSEQRDTDRRLTFLAFMDRGPRKGGYLALNAFVTAFGERDDVRLILKWRNLDNRPRIGNRNVTVIARDLSEAELHQLYLSADVLISPTTGEGFGLLPREFAATGGISLATAWSGTAEDINVWGVPLGYELVPAAWREREDWQGEDLGLWAQVDRDALATVLRRVADNHDWYAARARRNALQVAALYSWERFGQRIHEIWQEVTIGSHRYSALAA